MGHSHTPRQEVSCISFSTGSLYGNDQTLDNLTLTKDKGRYGYNYASLQFAALAVS
jgi:hypothetical protein